MAIIPARGGSKGVLRKNIKMLGGRPLIAYTIEAALGAEEIDRVVVTTDDEEIAEISRKYGAEVPFMRPPALAQDRSMAADVYIHAVEFMRDYHAVDISKFVVLLPTVPFRNKEHIDKAVNLFRSSEAETLVSVKKNETPVSWLLRKDPDGKIINAGFDMDSASGNRQENREYFVPNGAIYILDYNLLKTKRTYYTDNTVGYVMAGWDSIDIDTAEDFEYAEYVLQKHHYT